MILILKHRLTASLAVTGMVMASMTLIGGDAHPVWYAILWAAFAVTVGFASVSIRRDLKDEAGGRPRDE